MKTAIRKPLGAFLAVLVLVAIAIGVAGYITLNQASRPRLPFIDPKPYKLKIAFSDAQAVIPGQGQSVRVAGVQIGLIKQVQLKDGHVVVTADVEMKWIKKLNLQS